MRQGAQRTAESPVEGEPARSTAGSRPRTRSAVVWAYVLTAGRFAITGLVFIWLATIITPQEFGQMALAMAWVTFAHVLAYSGPAQAVIQRPRATDEHFTAAFWLNLGIAVALAGGLVLFAPVWSSLNDEPQLRVLCWALAPTIVLNAMMAVPEAVLRRQLKFKRLSLRVLLAGLLSGVVGIGVAMAGYGVWALVAQQLTLSLVGAVAVWVSTPWRPSLRLSRGAARDLRSFSLRSMAEFVAYFVSSRTDLLMLGMFFGPAVIGLYRFAVRITEMVTEVAAGGLGQVSLPHLSRLHQDRVAFAMAFSKVIHAGALLAWPAFALVAVSAHELLALIGPEWVPVAPALQVMCLDAAFSVLGMILAPATQAAGRPGLNALLGWIQAAFTAAVIAGVGLAFAHGSPTSQLLAIAVSFLVVRFAFLIIVGVIIVKVVFHASFGMLLGQSRVAVVASLAALAAGYGIRFVTPAISPFIDALVVVGVAGTAAGLILLAGDPLVREIVHRSLRRVRLAAPAPSS